MYTPLCVYTYTHTYTHTESLGMRHLLPPPSTTGNRSWSGPSATSAKGWADLSPWGVWRAPRSSQKSFSEGPSLWCVHMLPACCCWRGWCLHRTFQTTTGGFEEETRGALSISETYCRACIVFNILDKTEISQDWGPPSQRQGHSDCKRLRRTRCWGAFAERDLKRAQRGSSALSRMPGGKKLSLPAILGVARPTESK